MLSISFTVLSFPPVPPISLSNGPGIMKTADIAGTVAPWHYCTCFGKDEIIGLAGEVAKELA